MWNLVKISLLHVVQVQSTKYKYKVQIKMKLGIGMNSVDENEPATAKMTKMFYFFIGSQ